MRLPDKKRIMVILIAAVIITIIVNFPHLFNSFSSEKVNFPMGDMMHRKPPMPQPQKHFDPDRKSVV